MKRNPEFIDHSNADDDYDDDDYDYDYNDVTSVEPVFSEFRVLHVP